MKQHFLPAVKLTVACILLFCGLYTLIVLGIAQFAPAKGEGQTIKVNNKTVGYQLEGQSFTIDKYFNGRPSAAGYNAAASSGSNKGPTNPEYLQTVQNRIDSFLAHNPGVHREEIPADLVTASGSGLDPDISPQAAYVQAKRIAVIRKIPEQTIRQFISNHINRSLFSIEKINVLQLNIDLDQLH